MSVGTYHILPQVQKVRGDEIEVLCKNVRYFPIEQGGETRFKRLPKPFLQIKLRHERATEEEALRVKCRVEDGQLTSFVIQQPDKLQHPTFKTGKGKQRKEHIDYSAEPVRVPGLKEPHKDLASFVARSKRVFGDNLTSQMLMLFEATMIDTEE